MFKVLNPEKTVAYCAIVLSEMALIHNEIIPLLLRITFTLILTGSLCLLFKLMVICLMSNCYKYAVCVIRILIRVCIVLRKF